MMRISAMWRIREYGRAHGGMESETREREMAEADQRRSAASTRTRRALPQAGRGRSGRWPDPERAERPCTCESNEMQGEMYVPPGAVRRVMRDAMAKRATR